MLTLPLLATLRSPAGAAALALAASLPLQAAQRLRTLALLRKELPADLAAAALEMTLLRVHAAAKWSRGAAMWWTRPALEQASSELVARHRVRRFAAWDAVHDLCCSVGGDALALALAGHAVTGIDLDPVRLALAEANAEVWGVSERMQWRYEDVTTTAITPGAALFFDPGRRAGERRVWQPRDYQPPLDTARQWFGVAAGGGIKVAPGLDYDALPWPCEVEVVSLHGEVKEAVLWWGALQQGTRSATLLPGGAALHWQAVPEVAVRPPGAFLYEPDGAVIRAHLVEQLAHQLDATKIDTDIAFLTSDALVATPFARAFAVHETLPFNLKQLRARLRSLDVGKVVVKKRGSPIDPQTLERQLRLVGSRSLTVILTHIQGRPSVILGEPVG